MLPPVTGSMGIPQFTGSRGGKDSNGSGAGNKGHRGRGAEDEDRMQEKDKVNRRLSAQLIDSSTPTGINTRKQFVFVCVHEHMPMCQS